MAQKLRIKKKKTDDAKGVKVRNVNQNNQNSNEKKKKVVRVKVVSKGTRKRR